MSRRVSCSLSALRNVYVQGALKPRVKMLGEIKESLARKSDNRSEGFRKQREGTPGKATAMQRRGGEPLDGLPALPGQLERKACAEDAARTSAGPDHAGCT